MNVSSFESLKEWADTNEKVVTLRETLVDSTCITFQIQYDSIVIFGEHCFVPRPLLCKGETIRNNMTEAQKEECFKHYHLLDTLLISDFNEEKVNRSKQYYQEVQERFETLDFEKARPIFLPVMWQAYPPCSHDGKYQ